MRPKPECKQKPSRNRGAAETEATQAEVAVEKPPILAVIF